MKNQLSPHVQIYRFPVTAITSIMTRVTGAGLTGLYLAGGVSCLSGVELEKYYNQIPCSIQKTIRYGGIYTGLYHTLGGIRHFVWDAYPHLLTNAKVTRVSYGMLGVSVIGTIVLDKWI